MIRGLILLLLIGAPTGFSQTLLFKFGTPFKAPGLDVQWKLGTNSLPDHIWVYHLRPNPLSAGAISNLMAFCSFAEEDIKQHDTNWLVFKTADESRRLGILFPLGSIDYETTSHFGPTNLAKAVPNAQAAIQITTNLLPNIGIPLSEIRKKEGTSEPLLSVAESETEYFDHGRFLTNLEYRAVSFRRVVDGAVWVGAETGGNGQIRLGEYGKPSKMRISWRRLEQHRAYPTISKDVLAASIRRGKAVQNMLPGDSPGIDWKTVKRITIKRAEPCYYAGGPFEPSDWLMPFVALWTTVETENGNVEVEIDAPVIDMTKTKKESKP